jgi:hypothetical protein
VRFCRTLVTLGGSLVAFDRSQQGVLGSLARLVGALLRAMHVGRPRTSALRQLRQPVGDIASSPTCRLGSVGGLCRGIPWLHGTAPSCQTAR